jgi:hypothetical protein
MKKAVVRKKSSKVEQTWWEKVKTWFVNAWTWVKDRVSAVWTWIKEQF